MQSRRITKKNKGRTKYTIFNIGKRANKDYMYCINFKSGYDIIPAGTAVHSIRVEKKYPHQYIKFTIAETGEHIEIRFKRRWHPGITVEDYAEVMFSDMTFS